MVVGKAAHSGPQQLGEASTGDEPEIQGPVEAGKGEPGVTLEPPASDKAGESHGMLRHSRRSEEEHDGPEDQDVGTSDGASGEPQDDQSELQYQGDSHPTASLRRTSRRTAGVHRNPHHLPMRAECQEVGTAQESSPWDPQVLANISETQLLLTRMLAAAMPAKH